MLETVLEVDISFEDDDSLEEVSNSNPFEDILVLATADEGDGSVFDGSSVNGQYVV